MSSRGSIDGSGEHRRHRSGRAAGPDQHPHPRADGAVSRAGRRPGADGLAAEVHLPGRGEDGLAGVRARRHATGGARDDPVGHDDASPTCTTSRRRSPRPRRKPGLRGVLGQTVIEFPVRRCEDAGRRPGARRSLHRGVQGRRADRAGRRAALDLHAGRGHACWPRATSPTSTRATPDSSRRDEDEVARSRRSAHGCRRRRIWTGSAFWAPSRLGAHGVWVDADDIGDRSRRGRSGSAHNPESNMKLASGVAPVREYLIAAGVALGLGTDGAASNNDLDMFEAMRQAAFLHKLASEAIPRVVSAQLALEMATHRRRCGARHGRSARARWTAGRAGGRHRRRTRDSRASADVRPCRPAGLRHARRRRARDEW